MMKLIPPRDKYFDPFPFQICVTKMKSFRFKRATIGWDDEATLYLPDKTFYYEGVIEVRFNFLFS